MKSKQSCAGYSDVILSRLIMMSLHLMTSFNRPSCQDIGCFIYHLVIYHFYHMSPFSSQLKYISSQCCLHISGRHTSRMPYTKEKQQKLKKTGGVSRGRKGREPPLAVQLFSFWCGFRQTLYQTRKHSSRMCTTHFPSSRGGSTQPPLGRPPGSRPRCRLTPLSLDAERIPTGDAHLLVMWSVMHSGKPPPMNRMTDTFQKLPCPKLLFREVIIG